MATTAEASPSNNATDLRLRVRHIENSVIDGAIVENDIVETNLEIEDDFDVVDLVSKPAERSPTTAVASESKTTPKTPTISITASTSTAELRVNCAQSTVPAYTSLPKVPLWRQEVVKHSPFIEAIISVGCSQVQTRESTNRTIQSRSIESAASRSGANTKEPSSTVLHFQPEIEAVFPSNFEVPPHVEHLCFPDNGCSVKLVQGANATASSTDFVCITPVTPQVAEAAGFGSSDPSLACAFQKRQLYTICFTWDRLS